MIFTIRTNNLLLRHFRTFLFVIFRILPLWLKTGRKPVIFSKFSGIGDIICTFPAALKLKEKHLGAPLIYHCHGSFSCLPRLGGITLNTTDYPDIGQVAFWYGFLLEGFYEFASEDDYPGTISTHLYINDFAKRFGLEVSGDHPALKVSPVHVHAIRQAVSAELGNVGPLIIFHSGPSWPVREWPLDRWQTLAQRFQDDSPVRIIQIGSSAILTQGAEPPKFIPGTHSFLDRLTLEETAALLSIADLLVGIDSGMLHLAACFNTPSVGIWGPTSPRFRFSPERARYFVVSDVSCQGCHHRTPRLHWITSCPNQIDCMQAIGVAPVYQSCKAALASKSLTSGN